MRVAIDLVAIGDVVVDVTVLTAALERGHQTGTIRVQTGGSAANAVACALAVSPVSYPPAELATK